MLLKDGELDEIVALRKQSYHSVKKIKYNINILNLFAILFIGGFTGATFAALQASFLIIPVVLIAELSLVFYSVIAIRSTI